MLRIIQFHLFIFLNLNLWLVLVPLAALLDAESVKAQSTGPQVTPVQSDIEAAPNDTNTQVPTNLDNNQNINITGGQTSNNNLFHSFTRFNVTTGETANFVLPNSDIRNVINRVVGGDPSVINGNISVDGNSNSVNLYLMNPAGIIFGSARILDVNGTFTATTANGIRFGSNNWFSASGDNNYTALTGNPTALGFTMSQPGGIDIRGNLSVDSGNLNLIGGTVISTGELSANQVNIATVPGNTLVTLTEQGSLLSLEIQPFPANISQPNNWSLPILSLPQLLTAGNGGNANRFTDNGDGTVTLSGSGITVENGDVALESDDASITEGIAIDAGNINISSNRNLTVEGSITNTDSGSIGSVNLSAQGDITVKDIDLSFYGGPVELFAKGNIITGDIDTSDDGNAGNVSLNAEEDIIFNSINTQGRIDDEINIPGGDVDIIAGGVVRGIGTIPNEDDNIPANTTISTRGTTPGSIQITHSGGPNNVSFKVGDASENGTQGNINAGDDSIITSGEFPVLPNGGDVNPFTNITISSVNSPPTFTTDFNPTTTENQPTEFTFEDLKISLSDVDGDNTFVQIDQVLAGTLTRNGDLVTPGTRLSPGDQLQYTPPANTNGNIDSFIISGGDGVSSTSQTIQIAITPQNGTQNIQNGTQNIQEVTQNIQQKPQQPPLESPKFPENQLPPVNIDPVVFNVDSKFATVYESYFNFSKRERVSLVKAREILLKVQKEAGINPAIIYTSFTPIELNISSKLNKQDKQVQKFNRLDLVLVTANGEPIRKTINTANKEHIIDTVKAFNRGVLKPKNNKFLAHSQQLYKWMVSPLEEELKAKGIDNLLFITDEKLRSIPLAALHDGKQFLVEKYSVGFTPSLSLTDTTYKDIRNSQVLAMGMSEFKDDTPLPAVPQEINTIAGDVWKGKNFLNKDFTFNKLKSIQKSQPFGILHLATHGYFRKGSPENHFIKLWNQNLNFTKFRELDLSNSSAIELLVLSACRTALGEADKRTELGFGGLAVRTGAKTALASLWDVNDSATLGLMVEFYQQLKKASTKSEALRQAQIAMLRGEIKVENGQLRTSTRGVALPPKVVENLSKQKITNFTHPYYWSAFTMIGNPW